MVDSYIEPIYPQSYVEPIPQFSTVESAPTSYIEPIPQNSFSEANWSPLGLGDFITQNSGTFQTYEELMNAWQNQSPPTAQQQDSGFLEIGQQTPEQIARNQQIMNAPIDRTTSGGGTGGGSVLSPTQTSGPSRAAGGNTQGRLLSGLSNALSGGQSSAPSFNQMSFPSGAPINYQSPAQPGLGPQGGGALQMQQTSPQDALGQYYNTAGYQLAFGDNPNPNLSAAERFQHSPGYQYAVDEALNQVQRNASSRGLLESGRVMRDMTDRAQNMALQDYGNWWNRQQQVYNNYQNRLAGLAGGPTGAEQAYNLGQNQANLAMQSGGNLATLFGNQGSSGFGGMVNTGAAQANAMNQAQNAQAQIQAANQATQLAGATIGGLF